MRIVFRHEIYFRKIVFFRNFAYVLLIMVRKAIYLFFFIWGNIYSLSSFAQQGSVKNLTALPEVDRVKVINELIDHYRDNHGDSARILAEHALTLARKHELRSELTKALLNQGEVNLDNGQYGQALTVFQEGLTLARQQKASDLEHQAMQRIAVSFHFQNQSDSALKYAFPALTYFRKNGQTLEEATISSFIGYVYKRLGLHQEALGYFEDALTLREALGDENEIAKSLNAIGSLHLERDNYSDALSYYEKAYASSEKIGVMRGMATSQTQIGLIHIKMNILDKAETALRSSLEYSSKSNLRRETAQAYMYLGTLFSIKNNPDSANRYFHDAISIRTALKDTFSLIETLVEYGTALNLLGNHRLALQPLATAESLLTTQTSPILKKKVYSAQADAYLKLDEQAPFMDRFKMIYALEDKDNSQNVGMELYAARNRLEKKEEQALKEKQKAASDSLQLLSIIVVCISLIAIMGIVLFLLQLRSNRRIRKQHAVIQEKNIHLEEVNLVLNRLNEELNTSQEKLVELNHTKDRFFSIIGHDLRSPLASLALYLDEFVLSNQTEDPVHREAGVHLRRAVTNLNELINNLLTWALSQSGKLDFKPLQVALGASLNKSLELMAPIAEAKGIELVSKIEGKAHILGDPDMLDLIIRNLISNAIKFTPSGGKIVVHVRDADAYAVLEVTDTGIGIAEEKLPDLFTFARIRSTKGTNSERGAGLGLVLIKDFVDRHQGMVEVTSRLGHGSTFRVMFPTAVNELRAMA